ncbi:hypothetical protein GAP32_142 [Cronobacter phage vB_CsaM_GAP32]|uniref:Uncharacterized protein n=1 Tax=Cronobacter phage vB_CsaM_GAP32 TaxID=1141136 RepID=K4F7B3_9CAUD|nr:hypothetical protein GAP32_142 [Cronobacter phage vB_CsaM_GAP32]AFC21592.1 hypothetical protein GAP32_142 [Cronobacter phage vB_CsaM_GAP32]
MTDKIIYQKKFDGNMIEELDPYDILNSDDIETDAFGDAHGTFTVTVTYTPPDYDPNEE